MPSAFQFALAYESIQLLAHCGKPFFLLIKCSSCSCFGVSLPVFFQNMTREEYVDMHRKHLLVGCLVVIF